ncbi:MAG: cyclase family protein [Burkholderiales bacterium]
MNPRWKKRPPGSNWGEFGPDDQCGRLNLLTPEKVRQGIAEAREGVTFNLSLPLDYPGGNELQPRRHPPRLQAARRAAVDYYVRPFRLDHPGCSDVVCDDAVLLHLQYSTQWDALAHIGSLFDADGDGEPEPVFYNGWRGGEHIVKPDPDRCGLQGATRLGIENMAQRCVQGRGVMIDLHHHFGTARKRVGYDELMRVMEADGVGVEPGDMVCLHTGFAQMVLDMRGDPDVRVLQAACAVLDGNDARLLEWIGDSGLAVLIADNYAVEERLQQAPPGYRGPLLPLHEHCLFKLGVHLGELWHLTPLAAWLRQHRRTRFLLTAPPLRLPGAVGSPVSPVATV